MSARAADWVQQWAERSGVACRETERGWALLLPDSRQVAVTARDGKFALRTSLPCCMSNRSLRQLLQWQFAQPCVLSIAAPPDATFVTATLPTDGLSESHAFALMDAMMGRCADADGERRRDVALVRRWWERERGGLDVRESEGALSLRCRLPDSALPVELLVEPTTFGVRLRSDIIAAPFVESTCAPTLHRYLLTVNAHVAFGGFALTDDGSPTFCLMLPSPVSGAHVERGIGSLLACHQRFARSVKTIATDVTVATWWHRLNVETGGGESK